jgi:hypothetical protein
MSIRLAPGELCAPPTLEGPRSYLRDPQRFAWIEVVKAIARDSALNKAMLGALAERVLPAYLQAAAQCGFLQPCPLLDPEDLELRARRQDCPVIFSQFAQALHAWSREYSLLSPGFLWIALQTLCRWWQEPRLVRRRVWGVYGPTEAQSYHGAQPTFFSVSSWHPQTEPREVAERRIMRELRAQMTQNLDATASAFQTPGTVFRGEGAVPTPVKQDDTAHFDWFVRYQVKGDSFSQIGRDVGIERTAIQRAVDKLGQLLDGGHWQTWRRPKAKGGRPGPRRRANPRS